MAMNVEEFLKYAEELRKKRGFRDSWEALAVSANWREVFGTSLPEDYYHPRDGHILETAMNGGYN